MSFRRLVAATPADVVLVGGYTAVAAAALLTGVGPTPLRGALGLPLLLFVPGYALLSPLFPRAGGTDEKGSFGRRIGGRDGDGIDLVERAVLAFGTSVVLLPLVCLVLIESGVGLTLETLVGTLGVGAAVGLVLGAVRRSRLPADERFDLPVGRWYGSLRRPGDEGSALTGVLRVSLALAVVFALAALGSGLVVPGADASYTSMALLTENESDSYVAGGYDRAVDGSTPLVVAVANHEGATTEYTVVVEVQRVDAAGESTEVVEEREVARMRASVPANETWYANHTVGADTQRAGEDTRVAFLLYRGDPPSDPSTDSAYRYTTVWMNGNRTSSTE